MSNENNIGRLVRSKSDFHSLPKHRWDQEVVRIVRASKAAQRRLVEWSPELVRNRPRT
jgi:hypothetical protein